MKMIGAWPRFRMSNARFVLAFTVSLYVICNWLNVDKLAKWFDGKDGLDGMALSAYLLAGFVCF